MNKHTKPVTIIDAIRHKQLLGSLPAFSSLETWQSWLVWLKAIHALPMDDNELEVYKQCTGRTAPPQVPPTEIFTICGRRGGKSFISSLMLIRLFQHNTTYSVRRWRGLRFHIVCANSSDSSLAKRPVRSIWPPVVGLTDLSVRSAVTSVRTS
jgi:hypothetical protein